MCRTALDVGFAGAQIAHCYNAATHQQLGYSVIALLLLAVVTAFQRFGRSA
jgi:hypothetical protein